MKIYFIIVDDDDGSENEYHSSIAKAKKSRTNWKRHFKKQNMSGTVHPAIFKAEFRPTKQGFIRYLNSQGGMPIFNQNNGKSI